MRVARRWPAWPAAPALDSRVRPARAAFCRRRPGPAPALAFVQGKDVHDDAERIRDGKTWIRRMRRNTGPPAAAPSRSIRTNRTAADIVAARRNDGLRYHRIEPGLQDVDVEDGRLGGFDGHVLAQDPDVDDEAGEVGDGRTSVDYRPRPASRRPAPARAGRGGRRGEKGEKAAAKRGRRRRLSLINPSLISSILAHFPAVLLNQKDVGPLPFSETSRSSPIGRAPTPRTSSISRRGRA